MKKSIKQRRIVFLLVLLFLFIITPVLLYLFRDDPTWWERKRGFYGVVIELRGNEVLVKTNGYHNRCVVDISSFEDHCGGEFQNEDLIADGTLIGRRYFFVADQEIDQDYLPPKVKAASIWGMKN